MYRNTPYKTLFIWLLVNLALPLFLPAIILYAYSISQGGSDGFGDIFIKTDEVWYVCVLQLYSNIQYF